MENIITSPHNERIKNLLKLQKAHERREQNLIIIEGEREITLALKSKFEILEIFYCPEIIKSKKILEKFSGQINSVSEPIFHKIC